jgi:hypothetical protein
MKVNKDREKKLAEYINLCVYAVRESISTELAAPVDKKYHTYATLLKRTLTAQKDRGISVQSKAFDLGSEAKQVMRVLMQKIIAEINQVGAVAREDTAQTLAEKARDSLVEDPDSYTYFALKFTERYAQDVKICAMLDAQEDVNGRISGYIDGMLKVTGRDYAHERVTLPFLQFMKAFAWAAAMQSWYGCSCSLTQKATFAILATGGFPVSLLENIDPYIRPKTVRVTKKSTDDADKKSDDADKKSDASTSEGDAASTAPTSQPVDASPDATAAAILNI